MKALVIGAAGQLARSLAERAASRPEIALRTLARPEIDLADPATILAINGVDADIVINAAAYTAVDRAEDEPDLAFRINADAAGELAALAYRSGAGFVQISTDYVFDGADCGAYGEDASPNPLGVYGRSKLAGEEAVRDAHAQATIVRTSWVYSPFGQNFLRTMLALASQRERVSVVNDQFGNPTSALDLADGVLAMVLRQGDSDAPGRGGAYHLAGTGTTNWAGFAARIFDACRTRGLPTPAVAPIPTSGWPTKAARPVNSALDCRKFARDFGFTMPEWSESVDATVARLIGTVEAPLD